METEDSLKYKDKNILVPIYLGYGRAIESLGILTNNHETFFRNPDEFDMVLFTGGEDVNPKFYGDKSPLRLCSFNTERDILEIEIFHTALKHGILMAGICRGLQLFNVMAGGKLMHHISGHSGSTHTMSIINGDEFKVNSMHHQMIIPEDGAIVTGWSSENLSKVYIGSDDEKIKYNGVEIESAIFPKLKAFGVQYHPECMEKDSHGYTYFESMADDALNKSWEEFLTLYLPTTKDAARSTT